MQTKINEILKNKSKINEDIYLSDNGTTFNGHQKSYQ